MSHPEERKFIHDIVTPVTVIEYQVEKAIELLQSETVDQQATLEAVKKADTNIKKLWAIIQERRTILKNTKPSET